MFRFYKYIKPNWYFATKVKSAASPVYFPNYDELPNYWKQQIVLDKNYSDSESSLWDAAWQAFNLGFISTDQQAIPALSDHSHALRDEYRFILKYFGLKWGLFTLFFRSLSSKNPIIEWYSFWVTIFNYPRRLTWKILPNRIDHHHKRRHHKLSVVMATRDRPNHINILLKQLCNQANYIDEVIVVDQSSKYNPYSQGQYDFKLRVLYQPKLGQWTARNAGIRAAKGDWILLCDDDIKPSAHWLQAHIQTMRQWNADISTGALFNESPDLSKYQPYKYSEQFCGNTLVKKSIFEKIGLFDTTFDLARGGDAEFGLRAYQAGLKNIWSRDAYVIDLKASQGGLRAAGNWSAYRPTSLLKLRPLPSILYFYFSCFSLERAVITYFIHVPMSFFVSKKYPKIGKVTSLAIFFMGLPIWTCLAIISFFKAKRMIQ